MEWKRLLLLRIYIVHACKRLAVSRAILSTACALFCFSESTSSMPARDWQCRGQSFLLLVLSKDNVFLQSSLCSNGCGTDLAMNMTLILVEHALILVEHARRANLHLRLQYLDPKRLCLDHIFESFFPYIYEFSVCFRINRFTRAKKCPFLNHFAHNP